MPLETQDRELNETAIPTSAGMETPTQTTTRIRRALEPSVSTNELAEPPAPVQVPEPAVETLPADTMNVARNVSRNAQGFIEAQTAEQARLRELQDTFGSLNDEGSLSDFFSQQRQEFGATPQALQELQDIQLRLNDINTESGVTETRIEGAAGQTLGTAQREVTQEQRENAVRTAGLAARAAVIQGNIETATQLARDAVNIEYQQRTLTANNLLQQINMVQGQVDEQTAQLLEQEKRTYEAELAKIEEVKSNVANAMVNGATQAEIAQLTSDQLGDDEKIALAQSITARGAEEMRDLQIQESQASIANSYSAIADRNNRFELDLMKFEQSTLDAVREQQELAATEEEKKQIENTAKGDKALSMLAAVNELATHPGLDASVGPNPLARVNYNLLAGGVFAEMVTGEKSEFKSEVDRLANTLTLENMDLLKGPATDKDVEIVAASMSRLKNMDVTEDSYLQELARLQSAAQRIVDQVGVTPEQLQYYGLATPEEVSEVDVVWGGPQGSSSTEIDFNFDI